MRSLALPALLVSCLIAGCGDRSMQAEDYPRSCAEDEACVVVLEGDVCGCGSGEDLAAIRADALDAWLDDRVSLQRTCGHGEGDCAPLPGATAVCLEGRCEAELSGGDSEPLRAPFRATALSGTRR